MSTSLRSRPHRICSSVGSSRVELVMNRHAEAVSMGCEKRAIDDQAPYVMLEVQTFLLMLVIGNDILAFAVCVVPSAILTLLVIY